MKTKECKLSHNTFETTEHGKDNMRLLNGYFIWWCYAHNQPKLICDLNQARTTLANVALITKDYNEK